MNGEADIVGQTISQTDRQTDKTVSVTDSLILTFKVLNKQAEREMDTGKQVDRLSLKVTGRQTEISRDRSFTYPTPLTTS